MTQASITDLEMAQMMCSKLCHDLITPVGAIGNGLELLAEPSAGSMNEMMDLVAQSAQTSAQRLSLFRFAFGVGATFHVHTLSDLEPLMNRCIDRKRFSMHWQVDPNSLAGDPLAKVWGKVIVNIMMMGMEALPYGGQIVIECAGPQGPETKIQIMMRAQRVCWKDEYSQILANGLGETLKLNPRNVQPFFTWRLANSIDVSMNVDNASSEDLQLSLVGKTAETQLMFAGR
ncbi:MAG: histidine phosphotransferase family protein [Pseudomonadota bacterium]